MKDWQQNMLAALLLVAAVLAVAVATNEPGPTIAASETVAPCR